MTQSDIEEIEKQEEEGGMFVVRRPGRNGFGEETSSSLWLLTFTDIMALMLTFFVLLYSMSTPTEEDWKDVTTGLNNQFSKTRAAQWHAGPSQSINVDKVDFKEALDLGYLSSVVAGIIEKDERLKNIVLIPQSDHLVVSVPQELLFEAGKAEISTKGKRVLFALGGAMSRIRNRIEVIGHTDPRAIQNKQNGFSSNWELSLARAGSVASILENVGYTRPVIVRGLSSSRYDDLPEDLSEEERLSLARRVDVVIMKDGGDVRQFLQLDDTAL